MKKFKLDYLNEWEFLFEILEEDVKKELIDALICYQQILPDNILQSKGVEGIKDINHLETVEMVIDYIILNGFTWHKVKGHLTQIYIWKHVLYNVINYTKPEFSHFLSYNKEKFKKEYFGNLETKFINIK